MNKLDFNKHLSLVVAADLLNYPGMLPILTKRITSKFYNDFIYDALAL
jgi:hypothetical protein